MSFNILIVEDSLVVREVIKKTVRISGVSGGEILEAQNGREGLKRARDHWVDLILTDLNMPEMDGLNFIEELKVDEVLRSIPIIVISQEGRDKMVNKAMSLGASQYLIKPFRPEQIGEVVLKELGYNVEQ